MTSRGGGDDDGDGNPKGIQSCIKDVGMACFVVEEKSQTPCSNGMADAGFIQLTTPKSRRI